MTVVQIDLPGVTIAIGERELLQNAHLRIKEGVHYGLVGRNGSGKSCEPALPLLLRSTGLALTFPLSSFPNGHPTALLRALADRLIPGLPTNLKILLVSQLETDLLAADGAQGAAKTVLQVVMDSDRARARAEREMQGEQLHVPLEHFLRFSHGH